VWAVLDDLEVSVVNDRRALDELRARLGEGGVRAVVHMYIVFYRRPLDELSPKLP